jgi:hypothetical protein
LFKADANKPGGFIGLMFDNNDYPWVWLNGPGNSWNGSIDHKNVPRWR